MIRQDYCPIAQGLAQEHDLLTSALDWAHSVISACLLFPRQDSTTDNRCKCLFLQEKKQRTSGLSYQRKINFEQYVRVSNTPRLAGSLLNRG
jgi:hypothetical protein